MDVLTAVRHGVRNAREVVVRILPVRDLSFDGAHERLVRALTNIANNAVDASADGGVVTLGAERSPDDSEVVFTISDRGAGIPASMREDIYRFGRTSKRNTGHSGLGLYVAKKVVVGEHNGWIRIDDALGGGTVFTVGIPLEAPSRRRHEPRK